MHGVITATILEIDAVVSMIEKVLESTDSYLQEEVSTRGLSSDSNYGNRLMYFFEGRFNYYYKLKYNQFLFILARAEHTNYIINWQSLFVEFSI